MNKTAQKHFWHAYDRISDLCVDEILRLNGDPFPSLWYMRLEIIRYSYKLAARAYDE